MAATEAAPPEIGLIGHEPFSSHTRSVMYHAGAIKEKRDLRPKVCVEWDATFGASITGLSLVTER